MKKNKLFSLASSLVLVSLMTSCGVSPLARFVPQPQRLQPTITVAPQNLAQNTQPTLPDDRVAKTIEFEVENKKEVKVRLGTTKSFTVNVTFEDDEQEPNYSNVNWVSTDANIGTVNKKGVFTPLREGKTQLIASIGGVAAKLNVVVSEGKYIWKQIPVPTQNELFDAKMVTDTEAWAVGAGGTIMHYQRGTWFNLTRKLMRITGGANLYSIDMINRFEGWAVGDNVILHFSNGNWFKVPTPASGTFRSVDVMRMDMRRMSGFNNNNNVLNGTFNNYNNFNQANNFQPMNSFNNGMNNNYMYNATMNNRQYFGWIVGEGDDGGAVALKFDSRVGWQSMPVDINKPLNSVSVLGPDSAFAVGENTKLTRPGIYQFAGGEWDKVSFTNSIFSLEQVKTGNFNLKSIQMLNSTQGWAVGEYTPLLGGATGRRGVMFKYDSVNNIWKEVKLKQKYRNELSQVTFNTVGMMSGNKGWVLANTVTRALNLDVNNEINVNLLTTDGRSISPSNEFEMRAQVEAFNGIDLLPNGNGLIVGSNGLVLHHQYDQNFRQRTSNFGNFNGDFGNGYDGTNLPTQVFR